MAVSSSSAAVPGRAAAPAGLSRWAPLTGVGFVVLFFFAFFINNTPDSNATDKKWLDYYASSGNRAGLLVSAFLFVLAALCLVSFLSVLWGRIGARQGGPLNPLPLVATGISATCIALGGALNAIVAGNMIFGSLPEPNAGILRVLDGIGYPVIVVAGMFALALAIVGFSFQARRAGLFGGGLRTLGVIFGVLTLASVFFFPLIFPLVWCLVVSVVLLRGREPAAVR